MKYEYMYDIYEGRPEYTELYNKLKNSPNEKLAGLFEAFSEMILEKTEIRYDLTRKETTLMYFNTVCEAVVGSYRGMSTKVRMLLNEDLSDWNERYKLKNESLLREFSTTLRETFCKAFLEKLALYLAKPEQYIEKMFFETDAMYADYNRLTILINYLLKVDDIATLVEKGDRLVETEGWNSYRKFLPGIKCDGKPLVEKLRTQLSFARAQISMLTVNSIRIIKKPWTLEELHENFRGACESYNKTKAIIDECTELVSSIIGKMAAIDAKATELLDIIEEARRIKDDESLALYAADLEKIRTESGKTLYEDLCTQLDEAAANVMNYSGDNPELWTLSVEELEGKLAELQAICQKIEALVANYKGKLSEVIALDAAKISSLWERVSPAVPKMNEKFVSLSQNPENNAIHVALTSYPAGQHIATLQLYTLLTEKSLAGKNPFLLGTLKQANLVTADTEMLLIVDSGYDTTLSDAQRAVQKTNFLQGDLSGIVLSQNAYEKLKTILS